jgi:hypothetical protein
MLGLKYPEILMDTDEEDSKLLIEIAGSKFTIAQNPHGFMIARGLCNQITGRNKIKYGVSELAVLQFFETLTQ